MNQRLMYKYSTVSVVVLFVTFSLGLLRALIDSGSIRASSMSEGVLLLHIAFAILTGGLAYYLYRLASRTGLIFPKAVATGNMASIAIAGMSGLGYLLTTNDDLTRVMLYGFEVSLALTAMLVGYLYCFMRVCNR